MVTRTLSALESKLILHLEWEKQPVVTIADAIHILGVSYAHARQILHRLARDRWLALIKPGKYELIPAERGEYAFEDMNPLFIGSTLVEPYYFSFATAAFFHSLSTQAALTVFIATTRNKPRHIIVREKEYRLVVQPDHKFFGWVETKAYDSPVHMAEPEKTILDSLDHPGYAGDIPEIVRMLHRGKSSLDWQKLTDYALRFNTQALLQRLGYLLDFLQIPFDEQARNKFLKNISNQSKCYLGQPKRWKIGGEYDSVWHVVNNIPRQELTAEIEVR